MYLLKTNSTREEIMSRELITREHLPVSEQAAIVYVASLESKQSQRTMTGALNTLALELGAENALEVNWGAIRYQHVAALRARLVERYKPATVNKYLSALRGVLRQAWLLKQMTAEDYRMALEVKSVKGETLPAGRNVTPGEIEAIVSKCMDDPTPAGPRDAAIIACLWAGLRRGEIPSLDLADYDTETGDLQVTGKGRKERIVPLGANGAKTAMGDWLTIRGDDPGPLFHRVRKGGKIVKARITPDAIYGMLQKRAEQANVAHLSPHDFRRTLAGDLLDAGADLVTVAKIFGHSDPKTTARYDRRDGQAKRKAMGKLHFPYRSRML
jgi:site-specific recombinase XerC